MLRAATLLTLAIALAGCAPAGDGGGEPGAGPAGPPEGWGAREEWVLPSESGLDTAALSARVTNPYWPLEPGTKWRYEAATDEGTETIDVEVLRETKEVMGVECAAVRDTVRLDGELIEDTFDWYAQDAEGNVWYMGEDTKEYEGGEVVTTAGSWEAGVEGAKPGIKVWAEPHVGEPPYYQEFFEGEAEDLAGDLNITGSAETPAGTYEDLLVVEEWSPLDPGFVERKYYARGVGTVKEEMVRGGDEVVVLTSFTRP